MNRCRLFRGCTRLLEVFPPPLPNATVLSERTEDNDEREHCESCDAGENYSESSGLLHDVTHWPKRSHHEKCFADHTFVNSAFAFRPFFHDESAAVHDCIFGAVHDS